MKVLLMVGAIAAAWVLAYAFFAEHTPRRRRI